MLSYSSYGLKTLNVILAILVSFPLELYLYSRTSDPTKSCVGTYFNIWLKSSKNSYEPEGALTNINSSVVWFTKDEKLVDVALGSVYEVPDTENEIGTLELLESKAESIIDCDNSLTERVVVAVPPACGQLT